MKPLADMTRLELAAQANEIDLAEVKRWSVAEGMAARYAHIKERLRRQ